MRFTTNRNYDYPEGDMVALYSLITGKGQVFGNNSVNIPERLGLGCPADTFGYPCFRKGTIPIVVMFTDDPMNNGPAGCTRRPTVRPQPTTTRTTTLNGKAPTLRCGSLHAAASRRLRHRVQPRRRPQPVRDRFRRHLVHERRLPGQRSPAAARRRRARGGVSLHGRHRQRHADQREVRDEHRARPARLHRQRHE